MIAIDFVIVVRNEVEYTRRCVESLFAYSLQPFHLILVDNGSTDGTQEYFAELEQKKIPDTQITVIRNEINRGYVVGVNQGLERTDASYVVLCNNDIVLYPRTIHELIHVANLKPEFGLINPNSNEFGFGEYDETRLKALSGTYRERCHTSGFFALVKREVINAIGGLDLAYNPGYFDDMDYSERAKRAGFLCIVASGAYVYHYGSRSFRPKQKEEFWRKNRDVFQTRWGGTKWFAYLGNQSVLNSSMRTEIAQQLLQLAREHIAVFYLFLPKGSKTYFESLHDSFRVIEIPFGLRIICFLAKVWRSFKAKPISRVYVSDPESMSLLHQLRLFHRAEPLYLSARSSV